MATLSAPLTNAAWTLLGSGLTVCVLQPNGAVLAHIGNSAPALTAVGFYVDSNVPSELPQVSALGGSVWVKSADAVGSVVYAVA